MKRGELWAVKMEQNCQGRGNTIASSITLKQAKRVLLHHCQSTIMLRELQPVVGWAV